MGEKINVDPRIISYIERDICNTIQKKTLIKINALFNDTKVSRLINSDFVWLKKDKMAGEHPISQGMFIYSYPYTSDSTFNVFSITDKLAHVI